MPTLARVSSTSAFTVVVPCSNTTASWSPNRRTSCMFRSIKLDHQSLPELGLLAGVIWQLRLEAKAAQWPTRKCAFRPQWCTSCSQVCVQAVKRLGCRLPIVRSADCTVPQHCMVPT